VTYNELRRKIQNTILNELTDVKVVFNTATDLSFDELMVQVWITYGDMHQASIGSTTNTFREIGSIVYVIMRPRGTANDKYDAILDKIRAIRTQQKITGVLLRNLNIENEKVLGDGTQTICVQSFQYDNYGG
jgi:hypothetical protein